MSVRSLVSLSTLGTILVASAGPLMAAQEANGGRIEIDDPPPPAGDAVINQAGRDGATVRAFRVDEPLEIDGVIEEPFYSRVAPITEFVQGVPVEDGEPSELTELWFGFDDENVYVSAKVWDRAGPDGWIANEMRRDAAQLRSNDHLAVFFDTFYDRRNAIGLSATAIGGFSDFQITNEGNPNMDWNPVWENQSALFDGGWSIEMAIPFKSLRYRPGREQVWGVQIRRTVLRRNEWIFLRALPLSVGGGGTSGTFRVSMYATLVGIEAPPPSRNLEVKPYGIAGARTDLSVDPEISNDGYADVGLDVKYGITENLTADFTYNTDFAQVEVDEQQVNLTRFSLFFPEKREFFLEGRGIFNFGVGGSSGGGGGGGGGGQGGFGGGSAPTLFYSRQIGLQGSEPVPIIGGGRLTGKVGSFDVGALSIQTDDAPTVGAESTNFTVLRLRRDLLARSSVGVLFENRSQSTQSAGSNQAYGADASFAFFENVNLVTYYAKTETDGLTGNEESYQGRFSYTGDEWGGSAGHLLVGDDFNPEIGFVRRKGFRQSTLFGRYSPRPESIDWIRQLTLSGDLGYTENERRGFVESRARGGQLQVELENSDNFGLGVTDNYENLIEDTRISGATIPAGRYSFTDAQVSYNFGPQRRVSGRVSLRWGSFFAGSVTSLGLGNGLVEVLPQLSLEPSIEFNWIDLPDLQESAGQFNQHVVRTRMTYGLSPRMFVSGLVQYNSGSDTVSGNFRLRWEWAPGSELFIVYTEDRDTDVLGRWSGLSNRGFVIKINRLLRI